MKLGFIIVLPLLWISISCAAETSLGTQISDAIIKRYQPTLDETTHAGWNHSNSVVLHGMEKAYRKSKNSRYLKYIKRYVDNFVQPDGSITGLTTKIDGIHPGVLCLFLYQETGEKKYLQAAKVMRNHILAEHSPFNKTPDGAYWHKNSKKYTNVATVSIPGEHGAKQHMHGYMAVLMAASVME